MTKDTNTTVSRHCKEPEAQYVPSPQSLSYSVKQEELWPPRRESSYFRNSSLQVSTPKLVPLEVSGGAIQNPFLRAPRMRTCDLKQLPRHEYKTHNYPAVCWVFPATLSSRAPEWRMSYVRGTGQEGLGNNTAPTKCFSVYIIGTFHSHNQGALAFILQMRELRPREAQEMTHSYRTGWAS